MKKLDQESLARRDKGIILAILDRFNKQRLHRAKAMQIKVNSEVLLNDRDLELIRWVSSETWQISRLAERNPQYMEITSIHLLHINLYMEITKLRPVFQKLHFQNKNFRNPLCQKFQ